MARFRTLRIASLLIVLVVVGTTSLHQRVYSRSWNRTLEVTVYPIDGDGTAATAAYLANLDSADFSTIDAWAKREARRHDLKIDTPFRVTLGDAVTSLPPAPPGDGVLETVLWSLKFRWWAWRATPGDRALTRIRLFVVYQQGTDGQPLTHSLGLQKGLIGLVHAYASPRQNAQNTIVIAHELLHTVGALDKYETGGKPRWPEGYASASRTPLHPQRNAEIMAGRIPTSADEWHMAESLRSVVINEWTAAEINWLE